MILINDQYIISSFNVKYSLNKELKIDFGYSEKSKVKHDHVFCPQKGKESKLLVCSHSFTFNLIYLSRIKLSQFILY